MVVMLQITEQNLKDLENKTGRTLVGEILRQIEVVEAQQLSKEESLSILKPLIKNKVYEGLRQHSALIAQFSNGINFTIDFIKPPQA
jgi:hypothetical protein